MSDGGLGEGLSYWATIRIRGDLTMEQLKAVTKELRNVLGGTVTEDDAPKVKRQSDHSDDGDSIEGSIVHAARTANTDPPDISVTIKNSKSA